MPAAIQRRASATPKRLGPLIAKIRRRQIWVNAPQRNRNDVPRTVVLGTLVFVGLRISELSALDGEDLDFAGRRQQVIDMGGGRRPDPREAHRMHA